MLFLVPADAENIIDAYKVLCNELALYNPELLDKDRLLGISKSDLIDEELKEMLKEELPEGVEPIFFSSITGENLQTLKDKLWKMINA